MTIETQTGNDDRIEALHSRQKNLEIQVVRSLGDSGIGNLTLYEFIDLREIASMAEYTVGTLDTNPDYPRVIKAGANILRMYAQGTSDKEISTLLRDKGYSMPYDVDGKAKSALDNCITVLIRATIMPGEANDVS